VSWDYSINTVSINWFEDAIKYTNAKCNKSQKLRLFVGGVI